MRAGRGGKGGAGGVTGSQTLVENRGGGVLLKHETCRERTANPVKKLRKKDGGNA